ncbi:AI-2E family transporter [Amycolatopsis endophytica]|uniref:Putative PurR-regulated permease PerM n=1 Tax=Amycolatopsis endophytica TaxID=860233 RepID=A0A853B0N8_9PSEU|nr:AI-2E family transporter [Amycolatopsis endophytica]NYI88489.1 putative PurR-regulated permease PerM [Amycolatopsis endophytica]
MSEPQPPKYRFLDDDRVVPRGLRVSAAFGWRFLVVAAAAYLVLQLLAYLSVVVIPVAIALLLAALLAPAVARLVQVRVPRGLATAIVLIGGLAVLGGLLAFVVINVSDGLPALTSQVSNSLNQIRDWLINDLHLKQEQIQEFLDNSISFLQDNQAAFTNSALTTATTVGEILTGFVLTLFVTIFFLAGGEKIWTWLMLGIPAQVRQRVDVAGRRGFASLVAFVRATAAVAVVDAVGVWIGLAILGVPLAIPLSTLVFLGAFIPIFGAVVTGAVAVLVALVTKGFVTALIVLAVLIAVMQLESHILQPLLLGRAVKLHPLAVVLGIAAGLVVYGIPGALLAVPLMSIVNAGVRSLLHESDPDPAEVDVLHDIEAAPNAGPGDDGESGEPKKP